MAPDRLREIRDLFEAALERPPEERSSWLRHACGEDDTLLEEVENLLRADRLADRGFTLTPHVLTTLLSVPTGLPSFEGRRIGDYDLIREIGRGGTGAVYLGRRADNLFSKHVALKILRPEHNDPQLLRRFHQERDIIARLDHPHIARLLDGGTTEEGLPYSVMEYVDGKPLDVYCDERRLTIAERIELIRIVCTAVQYAHRHLVVHRDLKPSNILVTADGCVKLLDFGIAKRLGVNIEDTLSHAMLATVPYASPEQLKGERITTTCDVYSLGVLAYELLTGRRPYATDSLLFHHLRQTLSEPTPIVPSQVVLRHVEDGTVSARNAGLTPEFLSELRRATPAKLARRLTGELDNIIMTALRKEPGRRYSSADHLGEDLRRYCSGLPVVAQPDTLTYRMRKFVRRHRVGMAAASMVVLTMLTAVTVTTWQARVARVERARAEGQAKEAEAYRARAERQTRFATEQLRIVEQRTREAEERRREALVERERAERRARDIQAIATSLLALNAHVPEIPGGSEEAKRAVTEVERILLTLGAEGFIAPALTNDVATVRKQHEAQAASATRAVPAGWQFGASASDYESGIDQHDPGRGATAYIKSTHANAKASSAMFQYVDAELYRGKRVRLSAMLKSSAVKDAAGIFADVQTQGGKWMFDDSDGPLTTIRQLTLRGTNEWRRQEFVFDVPSDGHEIALGFALKGAGAIWADDFSFDVIADTAANSRVNVPSSRNVGK